MLTAKVFQSGNSQAIRIPKEFKTDCKEFYIRKFGECFYLILHIAVANGRCCGAERQSGGLSGKPLYAKPYAAKGSLHE